MVSVAPLPPPASFSGPRLSGEVDGQVSSLYACCHRGGTGVVSGIYVAGKCPEWWSDGSLLCKGSVLCHVFEKVQTHTRVLFVKGSSWDRAGGMWRGVMGWAAPSLCIHEGAAFCEISFLFFYF